MTSRSLDCAGCSERLPVPGGVREPLLSSGPYWCERCSVSAALAAARAFSASASLAATSRCAAALSCWASPSCFSDSFPLTAPAASLARPFTSSTTPSTPALGPDSFTKIVSHRFSHVLVLSPRLRALPATRRSRAQTQRGPVPLAEPRRRAHDLSAPGQRVDRCREAQLIEETHGHAEIRSGAEWIAFEARRRLNGNPCAFQGSIIRNRRGTAATAQPSSETIREVSDGSPTTTRAASGAVNVPVTCPMRRSPWEPSVTTGQPGIPAHLRTSRRRRRPADDLLS
jgi:hypothetical protein